MDHKLLFKSNIMGNTAMRKNRADKAKSDRNIKRKELFSRGRDLCASPEDQVKPSALQTTEKRMKKSEEMAKKQEAHRAKFKVYLEEKKKKLEQAKTNQKPPFISAVGGHSTHKVARKPFEFAMPKPLKEKNSTNAAPKILVNGKTAENKNQEKASRTRRAGTRAEQQVNSKSNTNRPRNLKINSNGNTVRNNKLSVAVVNVQKETPVTKDKMFFNQVFTSTVRKNSTEKEANLTNNFEAALSPIDGIAPLEASICPENEGEKQELPDPTTRKFSPSKDHLHKTPPAKQKSPNNEEAVNFYVSPFVTTSRGKVSARKEQRNRDSVYKLELNQSIEEPIEVRRRREAVKYFRKALSDEINRLNDLCQFWRTYSQENANTYEEHCSDMINVAVGQTRLLISGKLKQFEKLVDDCELTTNEPQRFANSLTCQHDISREDLEGYWNIVKSQIENVDRRFHDLTLWKNHDWNDPDERPKLKKNPLTKSMKPKKMKNKINPSNELKRQIMKAHRAYLKNKIKSNGGDQDVIFVTRRSQNNAKENFSTPTKVRSPKSVANRVETPYRRSLVLKEKRMSNVLTPAHRRLSVLKNASSGSRTKRRLSETPKSSSGRKSILRTGVKSAQKKSVLFAEKIQYKSPESASRGLNRFHSADKLDESLRIMQLRNRNVLMHDDVSD